MPAKKPTNLEVFEKGQEEKSYSCYLNFEGDYEPDGSIEHVIFYRDEKYFVHTDWDGNVINPGEKAIVIFDEVS